MPVFIDMTGRTYGRLTVVSVVRPSHPIKWRCKCACGSKGVIVQGNALRNHHTQSCGCLQAERTTKANTKHGESRCKSAETPEHRAWRAMIGRCSATTGRLWFYYGSRGIRVCRRWRKYENFLADIGRKPQPNLTLERRNNNGDYTPSNCYWADRITQARNQRPKGTCI